MGPPRLGEAGVGVAVGSIGVGVELVCPVGNVGSGFWVGVADGTAEFTLNWAFSAGAETVRICDVPITLLVGSRSVTLMS